MNKWQKLTVLISLSIGLIVIVADYFKVFDDNKIQEKTATTNTLSKSKTESNATTDIEKLTNENTVISYLKQNKKLPDYYLTKKDAQSLGWDAATGNLCDALPGKAIGGDKFTNRENNLPSQKDRVWYEADINYNCGRRDAERIVFSNDGLIFITKDHYQTFQQR